MLSTALERALPYSAEQLFDLAADIERYPQFLPWWKAAAVRERTDTWCRVDNTVAMGPLELSFHAQAILLRPERIDVSADEALFRHFNLCWQFHPLLEGMCQVDLSVEFELRARILQALLTGVLPELTAGVLWAFEVRARALYQQACPGTAGQPPGRDVGSTGVDG